MPTKWISIYRDQPEIGEVVFCTNGVRRDPRFPVAAFYDGRTFVGVSPRDAGQIYHDVRFWFPRESLPEIPVLPGCYSVETLRETTNLLLSVSQSNLGLPDSWVQYRHKKAKSFFKWVPPETRLEVEPVSLVAELNVWEETDWIRGEMGKPADLDFYVKAREFESGEIVLVERGEWVSRDIPTKSEIQRRKLDLATSV